MKTPTLVAFALIFLFSTASSQNGDDFATCLAEQNVPATNLIFTPESPLYTPILQFALTNLRFTSPTTPKPEAIFTPKDESHLRAAVICSKKTGLEIRLRCGGHDFEGRSIVAEVPFVLVDLFNLRKIELDVEKGTVYIEGGATQGELYYTLSQATKTLAFPGGEFASVGIGGFISGGGYGMLQRKYGLGADVVIDARILLADGRILDREGMGEDLFWAIRGGGGNNFGVILSWTIQLVQVPEKLAVFNIAKFLDQGAAPIVYQWQNIADKLPEDFFIRVYGITAESPTTGKTTIHFQFQSLFLGGADDLLSSVNEHFPELGVTKEDIQEMSWIESVLYFHGLNRTEDFKSRYYAGRQYFKEKTDYTKESIPADALDKLWEYYLEQGPTAAAFLWTPGGAKMDEIPDSSIPFPFRKGFKYLIFQAAAWNAPGPEAEVEPLKWINKVYDFLGPYVANNPRASYANYRDLDLGMTTKYTTPEEARSWGVIYFRDNYDKLVEVKTQFDPENFFRNEQSIPPKPIISTKVKKDASRHAEDL